METEVRETHLASGLINCRPGDLKPWPGNPRTHNDKQLAKLKTSILPGTKIPGQVTFGSQFAFMAGGFTAEGVNAKTGWDAHAVARQVWDTEHKSIADASKLVSAVADKWTVRMEELYRKPGVVEDERKNLPEGADPVLIGAFFAATDPTGRNGGKRVLKFSMT